MGGQIIEDTESRLARPSWPVCSGELNFKASPHASRRQPASLPLAPLDTFIGPLWAPGMPPSPPVAVSLHFLLQKHRTPSTFPVTDASAASPERSHYPVTNYPGPCRALYLHCAHIDIHFSQSSETGSRDDRSASDGRPGVKLGVSATIGPAQQHHGAVDALPVWIGDYVGTWEQKSIVKGKLMPSHELVWTPPSPKLYCTRPDCLVGPPPIGCRGSSPPPTSGPRIGSPLASVRTGCTVPNHIQQSTFLCATRCRQSNVTLVHWPFW